MTAFRPYKFLTDEELNYELNKPFKSTNHTGAGFREDMTDWLNEKWYMLLESAIRNGVVKND
jgi:hypothetical protein